MIFSNRNLLEIPRFHSPCYHDTDNGRFEEGPAARGPRHFIDKLFSISCQTHGIIDAPSCKQSSTATSSQVRKFEITMAARRTSQRELRGTRGTGTEREREPPSEWVGEIESAYNHSDEFPSASTV